MFAPNVQGYQIVAAGNDSVWWSTMIMAGDVTNSCQKSNNFGFI